MFRRVATFHEYYIEHNTKLSFSLSQISFSIRWPSHVCECVKLCFGNSDPYLNSTFKTGFVLCWEIFAQHRNHKICNPTELYVRITNKQSVSGENNTSNPKKICIAREVCLFIDLNKHKNVFFFFSHFSFPVMGWFSYLQDMIVENVTCMQQI